MISYKEALALIEKQASRWNGRLESEIVPLNLACGRILAHGLSAQDNNPRFDNSAMDGFALRSAETAAAAAENPIEFTVAATVGAGRKWPAGAEEEAAARRPHCCLEIMTGAPFPGEFFDTVIRLEDVESHVRADGTTASIRISRPAAAEENIRRTGSDFRRGESLIDAGAVIGPQHVLCLSTAGTTHIPVYRRLRVAFFSTGSELATDDNYELGASEIRDSTTPLLQSAFDRYELDAIYCGIVPDRADQLEKALATALNLRPDLLITTGGVSVGKYDLIPGLLQDCGAQVLFHGAAIRPGKPILFATLPGGADVFSFPGNPVSVAAGIRFFLLPYLWSAYGTPPRLPQILPLSAAVKKPKNMTYFQQGILTPDGLCELPQQQSYRVSPLLRAEGWIIGPAESNLLEAGQRVEWHSLW